MANEQLKITVGADVSAVISSLNKASAEVKNFAKTGSGNLSIVSKAMNELGAAAKKATNTSDLAKFNSAIENLSKEAQRLRNIGKQGFDEFGNKIKRGAEQAAQGVDRLNKSSNRSFIALDNLSRVAQDAPYGIRGIANNINPLVESFQRLQKETGGTKNALKAMLGSLSGAGGIGLAVGVVSSLLVVFGDKLFNSGKQSNKAKGELDKYRDSLRDYVETLEDVRGAQIKGIQAAQEEITKLKTLYTATQNANIPLAKRRELVDELQKQYPKYFANIKDEIILAGGAKDAYNDLATAIIEAAKAKAASDRITQISNENLAIQEQQTDLLAERAREEAKLSKLESQRARADALSRQGAAGTSKVEAQNKRIVSLIKEWVSLDQTRLKNLDRIAALEKNIRETVEATPSALTDPTGGLGKGVKEKVDKINKELDNIKKVVRVDVIPTIQRPVEPLTPQRQLPTPVDRMTPRFQEENRDTNAKLLEKMLEDAEKLAGLVGGPLTESFQGMFDAILAGENPMKSFFDGLIQGVKRLIDQLIQAVIQAAILSLITGGAAGGGLSFGKAFGRAMGFSGVGGFAGGGGIGGGFGTPGMMNRTAGSIGQRGMAIQVSGQLTGQGSTLSAVIKNANTLSGIIR